MWLPKPKDSYTMAHFEIYILNYNGSHFLPTCLESLQNMNCGEHRIGINVVDNGSSDSSKELVESSFPEVNFIALGVNNGFSKGNNLGVKHRKEQLRKEGVTPDIHVFLNNDTAVEPEWIVEAAKSFENREKVGVVGSKSIFFDKFIPLSIETTPSHSPADHGSSDTRELGIFFPTSYMGDNLHLDLRRSKCPDAFSQEGRGRWLPPKARLFLAAEDPKKNSRVSFWLENHNPVEPEISVRVLNTSTGEELLSVRVKHHQPRLISLSFTSEDYCDVVQNAGSFVRPNWEAGDRGFLEIDRGQYDREEEIDSICGVSMFIRDDLFEALGGYDERYFAYYEDTDLSLRARLLGYKLVYNPRSVLRHIHCGSGVEHSEYFNTNVAYSQFIFASKMMEKSGWRKVLRSYYQAARAEFREYDKDLSLVGKARLRTCLRALKHLPYFYKNRVFARKMSPSKRLFPVSS